MQLQSVRPGARLWTVDDARLSHRDLMRNWLVVVMETGLRAGDAAVLPIDPLVDDSVGWPCLAPRGPTRRRPIESTVRDPC